MEIIIHVVFFVYKMRKSSSIISEKADTRTRRCDTNTEIQESPTSGDNKRTTERTMYVATHHITRHIRQLLTPELAHGPVV